MARELIGSRGPLAATPAQGGSSRTPVELFQPSDKSHPERPALGWMAPLKNTCSHFKEKNNSMSMDLTFSGCGNSWPGWESRTELHLSEDWLIQQHFPLMLFPVPHKPTQRLAQSIQNPRSAAPANHRDAADFCTAPSGARPAPA